jgi:pantetheine-phosphate adenylyltransferase
MKIAIYPGTFDPITLGHLDIIKRSSQLFDHLIVAVADNSKKETLFSKKERVEMINREVQDNHIENVSVQEFSGLLVHFVEKNNANAIVRGLRAVADFEYEFQMSFVNKKLAPSIETIFFPATENVHYISSSFVKEVARLNGEVENLVSLKVKNKLEEKNGKI